MIPLPCLGESHEFKLGNGGAGTNAPTPQSNADEANSISRWQHAAVRHYSSSTVSLMYAAAGRKTAKREKWEMQVSKYQKAFIFRAC